MRKVSLLLSLLLAAFISSMAQEPVTLTFTANTQNGLYCPFDAVNVTNVTRGWTETITYPDTVLVFNTGLPEQYGKTLRLGDAYPNPFADETQVSLEMPEAGDALIQVVRVDGTIVATSQHYLEAGLHMVKVGLGSPSMALLVVSTTYGKQVVRMVCTGNGGRDAIAVETLSSGCTIPSQPIRDNMTGEFQPGDMMRFTAVLFDGVNTIYSNTITQQQYENQVVTLLFDLTPPEVVTCQVTDITQNSAIGEGNLTATGGVSVTERGFCWGTNHNPTTSGSHANNGTGIGTYTIQMNSLDANTTYYVRAYAINKVGISYGNEVSFNTMQIPNYTISVSADPNNGGVVTGGGTYQPGQSCTVSATANAGYIFLRWTENGTFISTEANYTFIVSGNRNLVAQFQSQPQAPTGAVNGLFSVSSSKQVWFSQGNLQYIGSASTPYWKFADNQWDFLGTSTGQNSTSQNVDRDLFGWGTSGCDHGAVCYQPWSTSQNNSDYYAYGAATSNLYDQTGQADWGYNAIINGGNIPNTWRTLTKDEWVYVLNTRNTNSGVRYVKANVNNVNGLILLPDDWNTFYHPLNDVNPVGFCDFNSNVISYSDWIRDFQPHGAVFLPAAGLRNGISINSGYDGDYWSASSENDEYAGHEGFNNGGVYFLGGNNRKYGFSVRLVCSYK